MMNAGPSRHLPAYLAARAPRDPLLRAVYGHPVLAALDALGPRPPLEEIARTCRAYAGPGLLDLGDALQRGFPSPDAWLERLLADLGSASPEERTAREDELVRLLHLDRAHGRHFVTPIVTTGLSPAERTARLRRLQDRPAASNAEDPRVTDSAFAERDLERACERYCARVLGEDETARADAFSRARRDPGVWAELEELAGRGRRPGGRLLPDRAWPHWTDVRRGLAGLLRGPTGPYDAHLLRPAERAAWERLRESFTPALTAALFAWRRAGAPGSLVTFARPVGVNLPAERARALQAET